MANHGRLSRVGRDGARNSKSGNTNMAPTGVASWTCGENCDFIGMHWVETRRKWLALAMENGSLMNKMESFPAHRCSDAGKSMADFVRLRKFARPGSNGMMPDAERREIGRLEAFQEEFVGRDAGCWKLRWGIKHEKTLLCWCIREKDILI